MDSCWPQQFVGEPYRVSNLAGNILSDLCSYHTRKGYCIPGHSVKSRAVQPTANIIQLSINSSKWHAPQTSNHTKIVSVPVRKGGLGCTAVVLSHAFGLEIVWYLVHGIHHDHWAILRPGGLTPSYAPRMPVISEDVVEAVNATHQKEKEKKRTLGIEWPTTM